MADGPPHIVNDYDYDTFCLGKYIQRYGQNNQDHPYSLFYEKQ